jgi:L-threonylcarbamoyladenylate synthase
VLIVDSDNPESAILDEAADVMLHGGLVAFATETVYGLGAVATDGDAVARIFAAKGRPAVNPLIVHVSGIAQAKNCTKEWPSAAEVLARRFWPGPLSLVLLRSSIVPDVVTAGRDTVAVRAPFGGVARGLIERLGKPIAAPSANRSNRVSPTRAAHVLADLDGQIDLILDSGPTAIGLESTVLDLTSAPPRILRPGPIGQAELESTLSGERILVHDTDESPQEPASPGMMAFHYAPVTPAFRMECADESAPALIGEKVAVIVLGQGTEFPRMHAGPMFRLETPASAASSLYEVLHQCDALGVESIVVVMPPDRPDWQAIRDRVVRATLPSAKRA